MGIEAAVPSDAEEISAMIVELSDPFYLSPSRKGAEAFLQSVSVEAERGYLNASNYSFHVARVDGRLAGVIALRDNSHVYHLFVARAFQGQGLARRLWDMARTEARKGGNPGEFTVYSSLNAVPVYERFGFVCQGLVQRLHGICFQPMRLWSGEGDAAP